MKKLLSLLLFVPVLSFAQAKYFNSQSEYGFFKHMQIGVTGGTTGIGIDIATPINKNLGLRAGFSYMPKISVVRPYAMSSVSEIGREDTPEAQERKINNLCGYLGNMINSDNIDPYVDMSHQLSFYNAKLLLDWYPFHKKNWHFTAGFYVGSRRIAKAINTQEESPTMLAVLMYNSVYDQIQQLGEDEFPQFTMGSVHYELDPFAGQEAKDAFNYYGRVAVKMGDFSDGSPHYITPNENGIMQAEAITNAFKPYIGAGYSTYFGQDKRWSFSAEAGLLFFGKCPHIYTEDGVCLSHDVTGIGGQVGSMLNIIKKMPVYPVLELKLAYAIY